MTDATPNDTDTQRGPEFESQPRPMTDADVLPASDDATSEAPVKGPTDAKAAIRDGASKLGQQATDRLRLVADDGKAKAGSALDQLAQLLTDAAGTVDEKVGEQYGQYARTAAGTVSTFADSVRNKDVNELLDEARGYVRASPAVAIGVAATLGFVVARLVQSGLDGEKN